MAIQVTIIGLGQIGASVGLALAGHKDRAHTVGHDKDPETARRAGKMGAVQKVEANLPASVDGADLVLLALPADQIGSTLKLIARDLRPGAVLMETSPAKARTAALVKELLPPERHYVGLTPALNPACLEAAPSGLDAARADLFRGGLIGISAPPGTPEAAFQMAVDLTALLGASPYFTEPVEVDGIMAAVHLLPGLTAAALIDAALAQPGWSDIRKLAGRPFAAATSALEAGSPAGLSEAALAGSGEALRLLDSLIAALQELRADLAGQDGAGLLARLEAASRGRRQWWSERSRGDWQAVESGKPDLPKAGGILRQQLTGSLGQLFQRGERSDTE